MNQKNYRKKKTNRKNKTNKRNKKYTNIRNKNETKRYNKRVYSNRKINKKINKRIYSNRKSLYDLYTGGSISVQEQVENVASVERVYVYKKQRDSNKGPNRSKRGSYYIREFRFYKFKGDLFFTYTKPTIALIRNKKTNKLRKNKKSPFKNYSGPYVLIRIETKNSGEYTLYYIGKGKNPVLHKLEIYANGSTIWRKKIAREDTDINEMLMQNVALLSINDFWEILADNMLQQYRLRKKENITNNMVIGLGGRMPTYLDILDSQTVGDYGIEPLKGTNCFPYIPKESSFYYLNKSGDKETVADQIDEIEHDYFEYLQNRWLRYFLPVIKLEQDGNNNPVPKFGAIIYFYARDGSSKIYKFLHFNHPPVLLAQSYVSGVAEEESAAKAARLTQLQEELSGLNRRALQQRATEAGIAQDEIDDADNKEDLIELILAVAAAKESEWPKHFRNELGDSATRLSVQINMENIVNNLCTHRDDGYTVTYQYLLDTSNLNKNTLIPNFLKVISPDKLKYYIISIYYVICIFFILKGISKIKGDLDLEKSLNYYGVLRENVNFRLDNFYHIIGFKTDQTFPHMFSNKRPLTPVQFDTSLDTIDEGVDESEYESEIEEPPNEIQLLESIESSSEEDNEVVGAIISPPADDEPDSPEPPKEEEFGTESDTLLPQVFSPTPPTTGYVTGATLSARKRKGLNTRDLKKVGSANTPHRFRSSSTKFPGI